MAISIRKEGDKTIVELSNGHGLALDKIVKDYNLAGEKEALDFMLSILSQANGSPINNGQGSFIPSEKLKRTSAEVDHA